VLIAFSAYVGWPRRAHLREFDAAAVARLETTMWRNYYDGEYAALFANLYRLNREQYDFSPWDSLRIALYAARAAQAFQPTRSRVEAQSALPALEHYFTCIREHGGETFNPSEAARLELDWWQLRREDATPVQYGPAIARVTEAVFGVSNPDTERSALVRAEMMDYRDARGDGRMREDDWKLIEQGLLRSYESLELGLHHVPRP
jgi:hypothetical protein